MSTRCQIRILEDGERKDFYNHCDGYYDGVGEELASLIKEFKELKALSFSRFLTKNANGYEEAGGLHADIEYYYVLDFDKDEFTMTFTTNYKRKVTVLRFYDLYSEVSRISATDSTFTFNE